MSKEDNNLEIPTHPSFNIVLIYKAKIYLISFYLWLKAFNCLILFSKSKYFNPQGVMKVLRKSKLTHFLAMTILKCIKVYYCVLSLNFCLKYNSISTSDTSEAHICSIFICQNIELYLLKVHKHILLEKHVENNFNKIETTYTTITKNYRNPFKSMCKAVYIVLKAEIEKLEEVEINMFNEFFTDDKITSFSEKNNLDIPRLNRGKDIYVLMYFAMCYISKELDSEIRSLMLQGSTNIQENAKKKLREKIALQHNKVFNNSPEIHFCDYNIIFNFESKYSAAETTLRPNQVNKSFLESCYFYNIHVDAFLFSIIVGFESGNFDLKELIFNILDIKINTLKDRINDCIEIGFVSIDGYEEKETIGYLDSSLRKLFSYSYGKNAMDLILQNITVIVKEHLYAIFEFYQDILSRSLKNQLSEDEFQNFTIVIKDKIRELKLPVSSVDLENEIKRHKDEKEKSISKYLIKANTNQSLYDTSASEAFRTGENLKIYLLFSYASLSLF